MNIIKGITLPLAGETVLAVTPALAPYTRPTVDMPVYRRRMNLFVNRALSHVALTDEQRARMFDSALIARAVSPGVIDGFEVALEDTRVVIMPGHALMDNGEDIELAYPVHIEAEGLPVHASFSAYLTDSSEDRNLAAQVAAGATFTLADLRRLNKLTLLPHAMVLTAQPVTVAIDRSGENDTPCTNALDSQAFAGTAWEDGFRLVWVPWPRSQALPKWTSDGNTLDSRFRNAVAWEIFNNERKRATDTSLRSVQRWLAGTAPSVASVDDIVWPWERLGVALCVVGFDRNFRMQYSDRAAVVRQGGGRRNRRRLIADLGDDVLWQARVAQLTEQLAELSSADLAASRLAQQFNWLPPAGILPKDIVDIESLRQTIFPASYDIQAQPVPLEMVDALIAESSALKPYCLSVRDQVQILVPVAARYFEKDLLKLDEQIHPLFDMEVARLSHQRLNLLTRRDALRRRLDVLTRAASGQTPLYPQDDENALPDEVGALDALAFARVHRTVGDGESSVRWHGFTNACLKLKIDPNDSLFAFVRMDQPVDALALRIAVGGSHYLLTWGVFDQSTGNDIRVQAGALPEPGVWTRLTLPIGNTSALGGKTIDNLDFGVLDFNAAHNITWGYAGVLRNGREMYWLSDALPAGADPTGDWQWQDQGTVIDPVLDRQLGVEISDDGVRNVNEIDTLIQNYQAYLGGKLLVEFGVGAQNPARPNPCTADAGLWELMQRLQTRIDAATDHIEFGFLRARTDIYRVRQHVLGQEEAGRMLTSPVAAELITRSASPIATENDFDEYFQRAKQNTVAVNGNGTAAATATASDIASVAKTAAVSATFSATLATRSTTLFIKPVAESPKTALAAEAVAATDIKSTAEAAKIISGGSRTGALLTKVASAPKIVDVSGSSLLGSSLNATTVGERMKGSAAVVTHNVAAKAKANFVDEGITILQDKGFVMDDVQLFGYKNTANPPSTGQPVPPVSVANFLQNKNNYSNIDFDDPTDQHEAAYFQRGIDAIDNMVRFLRGVELRAEDYRRLRTDVANARNRVLSAAAFIDSQLNALIDDLAVVRHDLSVALSLRAEEIARVQRLVEKRRAILKEHVPFVVFRRPRSTGVLLDVPVRNVEPAVIADVVPRCRSEDTDLLPELQSMIDTLKEVPAHWFKGAIPILDKFNRIENLSHLAQVMQQRVTAGGTGVVQRLAQMELGNSNAAKMLKQTFDMQGKRIDQGTAKALTHLNAFNGESWKSAMDSIRPAIALVDIIRATPPAPNVTLQAAGLLDDFAGVAHCLYDAFSKVAPVARLRWAELFSQLDPAVSLRSLTVLPGYGDESLGVDYIQWRQMQMMVDWLFQQIEPVDDAVNAVNDLVRVCILLAAHAPVKRIITARIRRPAPCVVNARLDLEIDPKITKIGAQVLIHSPVTQAVIARAVVDDMSATGGTARITEVMQTAVTLDASVRVQIQSGPPLSTPSAAKTDHAKADTAKAATQARAAARSEQAAQRQVAAAERVATKTGGRLK